MSLTPEEAAFETAISSVLDRIKQLLLEKNRGYGNAAFDPLRVFSALDARAQLRVRIDDKLSRIKRGDLTAVANETYSKTVEDLIGYLVLELAFDMLVVLYTEKQSQETLSEGELNDPKTATSSS